MYPVRRMQGCVSYGRHMPQGNIKRGYDQKEAVEASLGYGLINSDEKRRDQDDRDRKIIEWEKRIEG